MLANNVSAGATEETQFICLLCLVLASFRKLTNELWKVRSFTKITSYLA